jgi:alpha-mannosidase
VALAALKPLEDGAGLVLRAYEPQGARGRVTLALPDGWAADAGLDLLEREIGGPDLAFTPFAVRSWRLRASPAGGSAPPYARRR